MSNGGSCTFACQFSASSVSSCAPDLTSAILHKKRTVCPFKIELVLCDTKCFFFFFLLLNTGRMCVLLWLVIHLRKLIVPHCYDVFVKLFVHPSPRPTLKGYLLTSPTLTTFVCQLLMLDLCVCITLFYIN